MLRLSVPLLLLCSSFKASMAFTVPHPTLLTNSLGARISTSGEALQGLFASTESEGEQQQFTGAISSRRNLLQQGLMVATAGLVLPLNAFADDEKVPMLTTDEFFIIVRDSARSIQRVEFSGPKAETVRVRLIDGTSFGISDVIESSTDPRSPLKIQAACREAKIPFKNLQMEAFLANAPKKTKMYTNQRVQDAAAKEKERLERLAKDEEERLAALYKQQNN